MKGFEAHDRARDLLDEAMILFKDIIQIFDLPDFDSASAAVKFRDYKDCLKPGEIGAALVDDDPLGQAVRADRPPEEASRAGEIATLGEKEIKGLPILVHGTVEVAPLPPDLDISPSIRHEPAVGRFLVCARAARYGANFTTQRFRVEWSTMTPRFAMISSRS